MDKRFCLEKYEKSDETGKDLKHECHEMDRTVEESVGAGGVNVRS